MASRHDYLHNKANKLLTMNKNLPEFPKRVLVLLEKAVIQWSIKEGLKNKMKIRTGRIDGQIKRQKDGSKGR